jgi:hypothetical protein
MKISAREEIAAPAETVFRAVTNFDRLAVLAEGRGVTLRPTGAHPAPCRGFTWSALAPIRGQVREIASEVTLFDPVNGYTVASTVGGLAALTEVELTALPNDRTRLRIAVEVTPTSLAGRILIQPLRLGKGAMEERFRIRVAGFARAVEEGRLA